MTIQEARYTLKKCGLQRFTIRELVDLLPGLGSCAVKDAILTLKRADNRQACYN